MRTSIVLRENRTQLVLEADTDHDTEVLKVLAKLPNTYAADFYDTAGGYTRFTNGGHKADLVIVFDATPNPENNKDGEQL